MAAKSQQRLRELVKRFVADLADSQVVGLSSEILVGPGEFSIAEHRSAVEAHLYESALAMAGTKRLDPDRHWAAVRDRLVIPPVDDEMEDEDEDEDVQPVEEPSRLVHGDEAARPVSPGGAVLPPSSQPALGAAPQPTSVGRDKGKEKVRPVKRRTAGLPMVRDSEASGDSRTVQIEEPEERETEMVEESVPLWAEAMFGRLDQLVSENNRLRTEAAVAQAESRWRDRTFSNDRNTNEYSLLVAVARRLERARRASSPQAVSSEIEEALALLEARVVTLELADSDGWVVASAFAEEVQLQDAGLRMKYSEQIRRARAAAASRPKKASAGRTSKTSTASSSAVSSVAGDGSASGSSGARKGKKQPACYVCGQIGHISPFCPSRFQQQRGAGGSGASGGASSSTSGN